MATTEAPAKPVEHRSVGERVARGKQVRAEVPRSSHAHFEPPARPDPIELLEQQAKSRVRALASCFSVRRTRPDLRCDAYSSSTVSMSRRAYHTSRLRMAAKRRIAARYSPTVSSTTRSWSRTPKSLSTAAISMLAASRLTSHSHGPGSVSSKSLRSKTSRRSGEAKTPKFDRWASPQHWTVSPELGVVARSWAMIRAAPR
jgi:hypothetical protein